MATTRDFNSLGVFAKDAEAGFVGDGQERIIGDAYRNVKFSNFQQLAGKGFNNQPVSENVNQQINNQSQFTDFLNKKGILGWKDDITYNVPAVVLASNGKVYQALKDNLNNNDPTSPINNNQDDPQFWQELVGFTELAFDLSSQVPGDEGAEQVGTYNSASVFFAEEEGKTLQKSLDENAKTLFNMSNMTIYASANFAYNRFSGSFSPNPIDLTNTFGCFNIDNASFTPYSITDNGDQLIGYLTINFIDTVPDTSVVFLDISVNGFITTFTTSGVKRVTKNTVSTGYTDFTTTSIKVGVYCSQQINNIDPGWGLENVTARRFWTTSMIIYDIESL